jgi:hypothetical protein
MCFLIAYADAVHDFDLSATAYSTNAVVARERPILLVVHQVDGDWQFLDGGDVDVAQGVALHVAHVLDAHPEVAPLADLPPGWAAERESEEGQWERFRWPEVSD